MRDFPGQPAKIKYFTVFIPIDEKIGVKASKQLSEKSILALKPM